MVCHIDILFVIAVVNDPDCFSTEYLWMLSWPPTIAPHVSKLTDDMTNGTVKCATNVIYSCITIDTNGISDLQMDLALCG